MFRCRVRRSATVALVAMAVLSLGAECVAGQEMTTARMPCCVASDHDCHGATIADGCCQSERVRQERLVTQILRLEPSLAVVARTAPALVRLPDPRFGFYGASTTELKAASPLTYVLLSFFLI